MTRVLCLAHEDGSTTPMAVVTEAFNLHEFMRNERRMAACRTLNAVPVVLDVPALEE